MASKKTDDNAGSKRAAEFHNAMLGLPGYGDDSMFFIVRYVSTAKQKMRDCDFTEFMKYFTELNDLWSEAHPQAAEGSDSRYAKAQELKAQALGKIQDYPDLVQDFERFTSNGRAVLRTFEALGKQNK